MIKCASSTTKKMADPCLPLFFPEVSQCILLRDNLHDATMKDSAVHIIESQSLPFADVIHHLFG
jgi:hypothetical protein